MAAPERPTKPSRVLPRKPKTIRDLLKRRSISAQFHDQGVAVRGGHLVPSIAALEFHRHRGNSRAQRPTSRVAGTYRGID